MEELLLLILLLWWPMAVVKVIGTLRVVLAEVAARELAVAMAVLERGQLAVAEGRVVTLALVALVVCVKQMALAVLAVVGEVVLADSEQAMYVALGVEPLVVGVLAY
jgi:hypothetical protein